MLLNRRVSRGEVGGVVESAVAGVVEDAVFHVIVGV